MLLREHYLDPIATTADRVHGRSGKSVSVEPDIWWSGDRRRARFSECHPDERREGAVTIEDVVKSGDFTRRNNCPTSLYNLESSPLVLNLAGLGLSAQ